MKKTIVRSIIAAMILATGLFCTSGVAFAEEAVQQFSSASEIETALKNAERGTTVSGELTGNLATGFTVNSGKSLELDLKGFTVNGKINNYGSFKAGNGTVRVGSGNAINCQAGTVNIKDMTVSSGGGSSFNSDAADKITIENCKIISDTSRAMYIDCSTLEMTDSEVTGKAKGLYANSSSVTVSGTKITAESHYALCIEKYCKGTITDSEIKTTNGAVGTEGAESTPAFYCKGESCELIAENCEISLKGNSGECAAELKGTNNTLGLTKCDISSESGCGVGGMAGTVYMEDCGVRTSGDNLFCLDITNAKADLARNTFFAREGASGIRATQCVIRHNGGAINVEDGGHAIISRDGSTFIINGAIIISDSKETAIINRNGRLVINNIECCAQEAYALENTGESAKTTISYGEFITGKGFFNKGQMKIVGGEFSFKPDSSIVSKEASVEKKENFWIVSVNEVGSVSELQEAINEARGGEIITLACDICVDEQKDEDWGGASIVIPKEKRVIVELNGNNIVREASNKKEVFTVNGDLTISDKTESGMIEGVSVAYGGRFALTGGTVFGEDDLTAIDSMGNVEIKGGIVKAENKWAIASAYNRDGLKVSGGTFITGGKDVSAINVCYADATISGAKIKSAGSGIDITGEKATVDVENCNISAGANCICVGYGATCHITGGDYVATGAKAALKVHQEYAKAIINNGNFTATKAYAIYIDEGDGTYTAKEMPDVTVKGGVFTSQYGFGGTNIIKDNSLTKYEISSNSFAVSKIMYMPAKKTIKRAKKKLTVYTQAEPSDYGADGFEVSYRLKGKKTWKSTYSTSSKTVIKKLKKKKYYYVKIRSIKILGEKAFYSGWTPKYKVKTK